MTDEPLIEELRVCPYDRSHVISVNRFLMHLTKCKKQNPDIKLTICPFDSTHHVKKSELKMHLINCPKKKSVLKFMQTDKSIVTGCLETPETTHSSVEFPEWEEWNENEVVVYDPNEKIKETLLYRKPQGGGKAARKKSRKEHIKNCQCLEKEEISTENRSEKGKNNQLPVRQPKSWGKAAAPFEAYSNGNVAVEHFSSSSMSKFLEKENGIIDLDKEFSAYCNVKGKSSEALGNV